MEKDVVILDVDYVTFEDKPEGLDKIAVGDRVLVTYTGTISEVDPFMGKIMVTALSSASSAYPKNSSAYRSFLRTQLKELLLRPRHSRQALFYPQLQRRGGSPPPLCRFLCYLSFYSPKFYMPCHIER